MINGICRQRGIWRRILYASFIVSLFPILHILLHVGFDDTLVEVIVITDDFQIGNSVRSQRNLPYPKVFNLNLTDENRRNSTWICDEVEVVNLAARCSSEGEIRDFLATLTTLVSNAYCTKWNAHIVYTNERLKYSLEKFFRSWNLCSLNVSYYQATLENDSSLIALVQTVFSLSNATEVFAASSHLSISADLVPQIQDLIFERKTSLIKHDSSNFAGSSWKTIGMYIRREDISTLANNMDQINVKSVGSSARSGMGDYDQSFNKTVGYNDDEASWASSGSFGEPCRQRFQEVGSVDTSWSFKKYKSGHECYRYYREAAILRRTHVYFHSRNYPALSPNDNVTDVTLVTQLQLNRLNTLRKLLSVWTGPASVTLYLTEVEALSMARLFSGEGKDAKEAEDLVKRDKVAFHVVYKRLEQNPINYLRNVAIREVKTSHYVSLDVDFMPSAGTYEKLLEILSSPTVKEKKLAFIIPAFETNHTDFVVPSSKEEFLKKMQENIVEPYHQRKDQWRKGHSRISYKKWTNATVPYEVKFRAFFEPYMVLPTGTAPLYHESMLERMRDKITHTYEVEASGHRLIVLHNLFAVHLPHPPSYSHELERRDANFQKCTSEVHDHIVRFIRKKYKLRRRFH